MGLGTAAPPFAAATRRYVDAHFGTREHARFITLIGDVELDEGNVWEAIADPATQGLGNDLYGLHDILPAASSTRPWLL